MLQPLHLCPASGKIVWVRCAVQMLAYLAAWGHQVPVLNGGGKGGTLRSFQRHGGYPRRAAGRGDDDADSCGGSRGGSRPSSALGVTRSSFNPDGGGLGGGADAPPASS